jgi:hypothetical protein
MELPEDLGRRIVEAASLAVTLHLQHSLLKELYPGETGVKDGGASIEDGGAIIPIGRADLRYANFSRAGADCEAA